MHMLYFFENYKTVKVDVQYLCMYKLNIYSSRANMQKMCSKVPETNPNKYQESQFAEKKLIFLFSAVQSFGCENN